MNRRVLELAQTDILTGLPNRAFFLKQLHDVNSCERRDKGTFSILMLDLDRFKNVNDSLGHAAGDPIWLDRARQFAMTPIVQYRGAQVAVGRGRYSLWTGDVGLAIYLWDCIAGEPRFPTIDVF